MPYPAQAPPVSIRKMQQMRSTHDTVQKCFQLWPAVASCASCVNLCGILPSFLLPSQGKPRLVPPTAHTPEAWQHPPYHLSGRTASSNRDPRPAATASSSALPLRPPPRPPSLCGRGPDGPDPDDNKGAGVGCRVIPLLPLNPWSAPMPPPPCPPRS